jgi:glycosyltransferase involved in cell wall biosynthesis
MAGYLKAFRSIRPDVVLAEYGNTGTRVAEACQRSRVPLVVHFHGYDASVRTVVTENGCYRDVFASSAGIVAVSRHMEEGLLKLGAPRGKVHYNPYGVDLARFAVADPSTSEPVFLAVGRFVEKKAPHLTLLAFARVLKEYPRVRLRMVGDGPLLPVCKDLARELELTDAVTFLGSQPHDAVQVEMQQARAFVQHSVEASNGDCEGTPVAILEAGASGLPVVSTRHAGIPDVVEDGRTGFLVDERDVVGMAERMGRLARDPGLTGQLGGEAARHIRANYSMDSRIAGLWRIIRACVR